MVQWFGLGCYWPMEFVPRSTISWYSWTRDEFHRLIGYRELFQNKNLVKTGTWKQKILIQKTIEPMILPSNCDHQQWPIQDYQSDDETCTSSAITTSPVSGQPRQFAWPFWPSLPVLPAQLAKNRWTQTKQTSANFNFLFAAINLVSLDIRLRYIQSNLIYVHR